MSFCRKLLLLLSTLPFLVVDPLPAQTIHVSLQGKAVEGKPVFWNDEFVALLAQDGQLVTFAPQQAQDFRKVSAGFSSHSQATLRGELMREFAQGYEVSGTGQFLVVHPAGQRDQWADRFEQLYRSMVHYLSVRGFAVGRPEFPLVAVVFPTQAHYLDYAQQHGIKIGGSTLGYYDPTSNRIYMYDVTSQSGAAWYVNAETIIHEAAHQTAFNVGIHNRLGRDPRWVVEGLGTLFEAAGVWDARNHPQLGERINRTQLEVYRRVLQQTDSAELLQRQLASDQLFARATTAAYAHAWALTFYLTEREPRQYADYVRRLKQRGPFRDYPSEERLRDFTTAFGQDLRMFNARLQRFIAAL